MFPNVGRQRDATATDRAFEAKPYVAMGPSLDLHPISRSCGKYRKLALSLPLDISFDETNLYLKRFKRPFLYCFL